MKTFILCFALSIFVGCQVPLGTNESAEVGANPMIQTDQAQYEARISKQGGWHSITIEINATFTNLMQAPVYFTGCLPPHAPILERKAGLEWVQAYAPIYQLCLTEPVQVLPGESIELPSTIQGACLPGQNCAPVFEGEVNGTYRLKQFASYDPDGSNQLAHESLVSNHFKLLRRDD